MSNDLLQLVPYRVSRADAALKALPACFTPKDMDDAAAAINRAFDSLE